MPEQNARELVELRGGVLVDMAVVRWAIAREMSGFRFILLTDGTVDMRPMAHVSQAARWFMSQHRDALRTIVMYRPPVDPLDDVANRGGMEQRGADQPHRD